MTDSMLWMGIFSALGGGIIGFIVGLATAGPPLEYTAEKAVLFDDARGWSYCLPIICHECHQSHLAVCPGGAGDHVDTVQCLKCDTRFPLASNALLCQGVTPYQDQGGAFGPNAEEARTKDYGSLANRTGLTDQDRGHQ